MKECSITMVKILIVEDDNDINNMIHDLLRLNCIESVSAYSGTEALLLLDEHTAALDPATSAKVLKLTCEIVAKQNLTAMMVTHNMRDAIDVGNRLIMMYNGRIIYDVRGEEKKRLTVEDLLHKFEEASGEAFANDRMLLG